MRKKIFGNKLLRINMKIIDANYILRYLLKDLDDQYLEASNIIEKEIIHIPDFIIAEVVYVLEKVYRVDRKLIFISLAGLIKYENIQLHEKELIITSLQIYADINIDYADAILLSFNKIKKAKIYTFDKKILSFLNKSE